MAGHCLLLRSPVKYWETKKFKELKNTWYYKLAIEGFVDSEKSVGSKEVLVSSSHIKVDKNYSYKYFSDLSKNVHVTKFDSPLDEMILKYRADGLTIKNIVRALKFKKISKHRKTVRLRIRKYENRWGIRKWSNKALTK